MGFSSRQEQGLNKIESQGLWYRGKGARPFKGILGNNTKTGRESR
jgi:hypothetical protein